MLRRLSRAACAAWLGLFALAVQAAIPALVAIEFGIAGNAAEAATLCVFGASQDHPSETPAPAPPGGKHGIGACPICIALNAGHAFTAPDAAALPLPASHELGATIPLPAALRDAVAVAAYRSRAPPLG